MVFCPLASATDWIHPEWRYRTPVAVENSALQHHTNQQAFLVFDSASLIAAGHLRADGADIRLADSSAPLAHWLEPGTINTPSTRLWLKAPLLPADDTATLFLYHNHPAAASSASLTGTFLRVINGGQPLLAAWQLDETSGATANDSSGNAHHGSIQNAAWTAGRHTAALSFNGTNAQVQITHATTLDTAAITIETWIKPDADHPGWLTGWPHRKTLTVQSALVEAPLTNFPVLVKLDATNFNFAHARTNGHDIRFTAADGTTLLPHERERHDHTNQTAEYWIKLPLVSATADTSFHLYHGNPAAADASTPTNVWDEHFSMVHHLAQTTSPVLDSTANTNHGTNVGTTLAHPGVIGRGINLSAANSYIECGTRQMPNTSAAQTLEVWTRYAAAPTSPNNQNLVLTANTSASTSIQLGFRGGNAVAWIWGGNLCASTTPPPINQWNQFVFVTSGGATTHALYINGVRYAGQTRTLLAGVPTQVRISTAEWGEYFLGSIDEVRISRVARSDAWIKANYHATRDALLTYGPEETRTATIAGKGRNAWQIETDPTHTLRAWINNTPLAASAPHNTNWQHIVLTHDGSEISLFLDGQLDLSSALAAPVSQNTSNILIGHHYPGLVGETRLYNRALAADEIADLFASHTHATTNYPGRALLCAAPPDPFNATLGAPETWPDPCILVRNPFRLDEHTALAIDFTHGPGTRDLSRLAHPVTDAGQWLAPGRHRLDGAGAFLTVTDHPALDDAPALTISLWLQPEQLPASTTAILSKPDAYAITLAPDGMISLDIATEPARTAGTPLLAGQLHHVALVFDGTLPEAQRIRLYIDGRLDKTTPAATAALPRRTTELFIGALDAAAPQTLDAILGPLRIIRRALGPAEIGALHRQAEATP